jgi:3-oxoacyl-[acyl-carrier protein] reductase
MDSALLNRIALVTGASGGIGGEVVRALVGEGARCVAHYGKHGERAHALADELGPSCVPLGADVTREEDVSRLFAQAEERVGPVEILVANAGSWPSEDVPVQNLSLERWNHTLANNLTSVFLCVRQFFRGVSQHGLLEPSVILIGSTAGIFGEAGHSDYAAAKAGLTYGLACSLKNELSRLAPRGRINVICPGWTFTPMTQGFSNDPDRVRRVLQTIPLRKIGRPHDVAMAVLYLASSRLSGHLTGQVLTVAGGMEGRVLYAAEEVDPEHA